MEPFVSDVKKLETEGITCMTNDGAINFKGSLVCCVADNLAAHAVGGFVESFTSGKCCRFCMINKSDFSDIFIATPRTTDAHDVHCSLVKQNADLARVYGVKGTSCLNELTFYHAVNGLPPDITHDIFEGIWKYVLGSVLSYCFQEGYFSLQHLNECIANFSYQGSDKVNKPNTLSKCNDIQQTASQTWCLLRLFPLMVGQLVPSGDAKWEVLMKLLDVIEFASMQNIQIGQVSFFNEIIEEFSEQYRSQFADQTVKPKLHFLHHYAELTMKYGPLVHCWSIRFEGKHNWFKQVFKSSKCCKNIPKTLAIRHQSMLASFVAEKTFFKRLWYEAHGG